MIAPDAMRPWATSPAVSRELRALWARRGPAAERLVFVVLMPGALTPETIPAGAWRLVESRPVALVPFDTARALAAGRSPRAASALEQPAPARCVWCLALAAEGSALTWATPVEAPSSAPTRAAGDA